MYSFWRIFTAALVSSFGLCAALHVHSVAYYDPTVGGGSMLNDVGDGLGEPLNVIISGLSSADVLTHDGFLRYASSIGLSSDCPGLAFGNPQPANLGDGNGWVDQTTELREDYLFFGMGSCRVSPGGNHVRVYRQNGSLANSGALFLAVSMEQPTTDNHDIISDGYNIGRDDLVAGAVGQTRNGFVYSTTAQEITGLLAPGSTGVNYGISQDGIVTLLTVTIL